MLSFIARRLLHAIPILFGVSVIVFILVKMIPGNPLDLLLPPEAPADLIEKLKASYGFDKPLYVQYFSWLWRTLHGDLGYSIFTGAPVAQELGSAIHNTLILAIPAAVIGLVAGVTLGTIAAYHLGRFLDKFFSAFAITGVSLPHYWFAIVMVVIFSVILNWLPAQGMSFEGLPTTWEDIKSIILPVVTLALIPIGVIARVTRATVLEVLSQDFVSTLVAKGLVRREIIFHVLKNAAPSVIAVAGLQFGYLLGGSILVETVFNWPGSGTLLNLAIFRRDVPVMQATIVVLAFFFVMLNLLVDIAQAAIDPRIRR
jgi:peptide/nickel transport system permease protein